MHHSTPNSESRRWIVHPFALLAAAAISLGVIGATAQSASAVEARDLIKCVPVGEETYCSDFGSMPHVDVRSLLAHVDTAIENNPDGTKDVTDNGGDLSMDELVAQLIRLSPAELKERQDSQIADARIVAAEEQAEAAANTKAGRPALAAVAVPATKFISAMQDFKVSKLKQQRDYWCGPATMAAIARGNTGKWESQATWAQRLGTTSDGTAITLMVKAVNAHTTWDKVGGTYAVWSVTDKSTAAFASKIKNKIVKGAPIVLHPRLLKNQFSYINFDHGGHFQAGTGYTSDILQFIEPYNEKDFRAGGADSAGYRSVNFDRMLRATKAAPADLAKIGL